MADSVSDLLAYNCDGFVAGVHLVPCEDVNHFNNLSSKGWVAMLRPLSIMELSDHYSFTF